MKVLFTVFLSYFLLLSLSASDNLNPSGKPGSNELNSSKLTQINLPANLPIEMGSYHISNSINNLSIGTAEENNNSPAISIKSKPFNSVLRNLNYSEKENSLIEIEVKGDISKQDLEKINNIQTLWKSGKYQQAINDLKAFEEYIEGVGISWRKPRLLSGAEGVDIQIGARSGVYKTELDFDESSGNLFAVVLFDDGTDKGWTVNFSNDGGATWVETYYWNSGTYTLNDVDASRVGNYFWVGYVVNSATQDDARIRRFNVSDGSVDIVYGWQSVFNFSVTIRDVGVYSNADNFNNRIYYYAITDDDSLRCFWDDMTGTSWTDYSPGISNVSHGLDVCWNYNASNDFVFVSYVNTTGMLHVMQGTAGGWTDVELSTASVNTNDVTSIAAYQDTVIIVYETGTNIEYRISYNEGTSWAIGTVAAGSNFHKPHVTGRKNGGFAVVYADEAGAFDPIWFVRREYSVPGWSTPLQVNEIDAMSNYWNNIEYIPPTSEPYAHGVIFPFFGALGGEAYFDRVEDIALLPPDIAVSPSYFDFIVPENGTDTQVLTINNTAAAGSENLIWNIGDQPTKLELKDGTKIPIKMKLKKKTEIINPAVESIDYTKEHEIGPPTLVNISHSGKKLNNNNLEMFFPTDDGFGPEYNNNAMGQFVLNDPENVNLAGIYPPTLYAAAEFGNADDFSFMYCLDYNGNLLVTIDIATGTVDTIGAATPYSGETWTGLAMDPVSGIMYASSTSVTNSSLYTVDLVTGAMTRIGEVTNSPALIAIAADNAGQMYGYDVVSDSLISINKNTAAGTQIGALGFDANFAQGMDFDETDGTLYLAAYNASTGPELRIADTATGATTLVGSIGTVSPGSVFFGGFGVATKADCPWLTEMPTNGTITPGNSMNVDIIVDASGLALGTYNCNLIVSSNDPDEPEVTIPVELIVTELHPAPENPVAVSGYHESIPLYWEAPIGFTPLKTNAKAYDAEIKEEAVEPQNQNPLNTESVLQSYNVYRSQTMGGPYTLLDNLNRQYYRDMAVSNATDYYYVIEAVYDDGISLYSDEVMANAVDDGNMAESGWTTNPPVIDGTIYLIEWQDAQFIDITSPGASQPVTLFIMNDIDYLYMAIDDPNDTSASNSDQMGIYFDEDHNFEWGAASPADEGNYWIQYSTLPSPNTFTQFRGIYGWWPANLGFDAADTANAILAEISYASGHIQYEVQIDLTNSDFNANAGDEIGAYIWNLDTGPYVVGGNWPNQIDLFGMGWQTPFMYGIIDLAGDPTGIDDDNAVNVVTKYELLQNYPNPFNPSTTIKYRIASQSPINTTLKIYNNLGQLVRTLVNEKQSNGEFTIVWDGLDNNRKETASGIYYYKLKSGDFVSTQKLLKLK